MRPESGPEPGGRRDAQAAEEAGGGAGRPGEEGSRPGRLRAEGRTGNGRSNTRHNGMLRNGREGGPHGRNRSGRNPGRAGGRRRGARNPGRNPGNKSGDRKGRRIGTRHKRAPSIAEGREDAPASAPAMPVGKGEGRREQPHGDGRTAGREGRPSFRHPCDNRLHRSDPSPLRRLSPYSTGPPHPLRFLPSPLSCARACRAGEGGEARACRAAASHDAGR